MSISSSRAPSSHAFGRPSFERPSVPRDDRVLLDDIAAASARIREYTDGLSFDVFRGDQMRVDAVVRNLEVIGEAAKKLSDDFRARMSEVPWQRIAGLRDVLIHAYFGIDPEIIWDVVQTKLPDLERAVNRSLREEAYVPLSFIQQVFAVMRAA